MQLRTLGRHRVNVGLVDDHQISQLHHAFFNRLQIITRIRQLHEHKHVSHIGHSGFTLAHTDGFNNHDVIAGSFTNQHGFTRFFSHTAQRAAGGAGPDVGFFMHRQHFHAGLVSQYGAARHR